MQRVGFSSGNSNSSGGGGVIPTPTWRDLLFDALDLKVTYQWYDPATALERIKAIYYSSATLGTVAVKQFFYTPTKVLEGSVWVYPGAVVQQQVGTLGGTVVGPDGVSSMIVSPGVTSTVNFTITLGQDQQFAIDPAGLNFISAVTFGPSGTGFSQNITVSFQLQTFAAPNTVLNLYVNSGGTWVQAGTATVDSSGVFATGQVNRI
jgi:hypothetical protein